MVDTDDKSYLLHFPVAVLASAETEKKRKYCDSCTECCATFTLLCFSVDGLVGVKAACFLKHLGRSLSVTWEHHYGKLIGWLRARLVFALISATIVCIRVFRTKWQSLGLEDGAAVPFYIQLMNIVYCHK